MRVSRFTHNFRKIFCINYTLTAKMPEKPRKAPKNNINVLLSDLFTQNSFAKILEPTKLGIHIKGKNDRY